MKVEIAIVQGEKVIDLDNLDISKLEFKTVDVDDLKKRDGFTTVITLNSSRLNSAK